MAEDFLVELAGERVTKELLRQLKDSIKEEEEAISVYRRRADYCRRGYPSIAKLYDHIREEEEHHRKELLDMVEKVHQFEKATKEPKRRWPWQK